MKGEFIIKRYAHIGTRIGKSLTSLGNLYERELVLVKKVISQYNIENMVEFITRDKQQQTKNKNTRAASRGSKG